MKVSGTLGSKSHAKGSVDLFEREYLAGARIARTHGTIARFPTRDATRDRRVAVHPMPH
jgi:hypothetical protein